MHLIATAPRMTRVVELQSKPHKSVTQQSTAQASLKACTIKGFPSFARSRHIGKQVSFLCIKKERTFPLFC
ncbi:unnamed protein product [Ixodes pacificus]